MTIVAIATTVVAPTAATLRRCIVGPPLAGGCAVGGPLRYCWHRLLRWRARIVATESRVAKGRPCEGAGCRRTYIWGARIAGVATICRSRDASCPHNGGRNS